MSAWSCCDLGACALLLGSVPSLDSALDPGIPTSVACHGPSRHTHTKRTNSEASEATVSSLVASVPMVEAECAK